MSTISGSASVGNPKASGLVPKRPSVAPWGATVWPELPAASATRPWRVAISM